MHTALRFALAGAVLTIASGCTIPMGVVAALQPYHSAGEFERDRRDARHAVETVGCLDLALDVADADDKPVLEWRMGNRCGNAVRTDLSRVTVTAERGAAHEAIHFVDPNGEIRPHDLAPRREAFERIALRVSERPDAICVDVGAVVAHADAAPAPACFEWRDGLYMHARGGS